MSIFQTVLKNIWEYPQDITDKNMRKDRYNIWVKINVIDWLFGHIKTFDRSVAEYINIYDNPDRL